MKILRSQKISLFKLPAGEIAIAAANVMVPLETLLTNKFRFAFSKELVKEFPYSFCNKNGCLVRMGLLEEDIEAMKRGANSEIFITHIANPKSAINLTLSLNFVSDMLIAVSSKLSLIDSG